jgi:FkbM family methyltransferase
MTANLKRRLARSLVVIAILILSASIALTVAMRWYPQVGGAVLALAGRAQDCTVKEAISAFARSRRELKIRERLAPASSIDSAHRDGPRLVRSPGGAYWEPEDSRTVVVPQLAELMAKYGSPAETPIRPGDVVLDCGANIGTFSRWALEAGARKVVAIEPAPKPLECLRRNLASEIRSGRVVVFPGGVWDKEDSLAIHLNSDSDAMDSLVHRGLQTRGEVVVKVTTIDQLVLDLGLDRVDFIKMDIEGAERQALAGAHATLSRWRPRLEISLHLPGDSDEIPRLVRQAWAGYRAHCLLCEARRSTWTLVPTIMFFEAPPGFHR